MGYSMIPLLMHSDSISAEARDAARAVCDAPATGRTDKRMEAARVLFEELRGEGLDCGEVLDLVGLPRGACP